MGEFFLIQRFAVENPPAPSGTAIIGTGKHPATLEQHYYDSRGVARIYQMMSLNGACGRYAEGYPFCPEPSNAAALGALGRRKEAREGTVGASSLGRYDRSLIREGDRDRAVLIRAQDLGAHTVQLRERDGLLFVARLLPNSPMDRPD